MTLVLPIRFIGTSSTTTTTILVPLPPLLSSPPTHHNHHQPISSLNSRYQLLPVLDPLTKGCVIKQIDRNFKTFVKGSIPKIEFDDRYISTEYLNLTTAESSWKNNVPELLLLFLLFLPLLQMNCSRILLLAPLPFGDTGRCRSRRCRRCRRPISSLGQARAVVPAGAA